MSDMSRAEALEILKYQHSYGQMEQSVHDALGLAIASLETDEAYQLEYERTTKNDLGVDAVSREAVLDLIADYDLSMGQVVKGIHALPSVTPQEPFMAIPCISSKVCEHDRMVTLDKIRAEIEQNAYPIVHGVNNHELGMTLYGILQIIDKYKVESEG